MRDSMFKFELVSPEGDSLGSLQTNEANWEAGETLTGHGNRRCRIISVVPLERSGESADEPDGVLEVEPL
jgi:hypothetical protein